MVIMMSEESKKLLGVDLMLSETPLGVDIFKNSNGDFEFVTEEMNLAQAVLHRLRTIKGELIDIGHPEYGSNLYDLVGEPNNSMTRDRIKMLVRETLSEEPRIKEITRIEVKSRRIEMYSMKENNQVFDPRTWAETAKKEMIKITEGSQFQRMTDLDPRMLLSTVDIDITIIPIGSNQPLNLVFPFQLEGMMM
jgi:phage baseplate assembly protein W